ncbi:MAG: S-formylglutathione hydrolase [Gammaproteobacteria bacterium]|nr:S-formylglutathione hydrolase [Gammaproteobacteria bacterium]
MSDSANTINLISSSRLFDGDLQSYEHYSKSCDSNMRFSVYLPPQANKAKVPVLLWLSGLTANEENFMLKSGAQRYASELGIALVAPDTSPRETGTAGEDDEWDFGSGAGFYVNATRLPWSRHFQMFDYVTKDLPEAIAANLPLDSGRLSVSGHSMGGHGALILALKKPGMFKSASAFSPICAPAKCPWGIKAFTGYLGEDQTRWRQYDASELIGQASEKLPLLIDLGAADEYLEEQLLPDLLEVACVEHDYPLKLRIHPGYDHSYNFVASFIGDHLKYHASALAT